MDKQIFEHEMSRAKTFQGLEPDRAEYWIGYTRGLAGQSTSADGAQWSVCRAAGFARPKARRGFRAVSVRLKTSTGGIYRKASGRS